MADHAPGRAPLLLGHMTRPCFLVVDREHVGSISTRKLVIETAKLNVITAYSGAEAIESLQRFPNIDGVVLDAGIKDHPCAALVRQLKQIKEGLLVIVIGTPHTSDCDGADQLLESFDPSRLLLLLQRLVPEAGRVVERVNAGVRSEP